MEIQIKSVKTRTDFEARDAGIRLAGTYETNENNELTEISADAYDTQAVTLGSVRGYRRNGTLRYDYTGFDDRYIDTVRTLTVAVVGSTVPTEEATVQAGSPAGEEPQEGGAE